MKQRLLWEAEVSELIQELLKRKSDDGESYFQLEVTQYDNQKQKQNLYIRIKGLVYGITNFEFDNINGE